MRVDVFLTSNLKATCKNSETFGKKQADFPLSIVFDPEPFNYSDQSQHTHM